MLNVVHTNLVVYSLQLHYCTHLKLFKKKNEEVERMRSKGTDI